MKNNRLICKLIVLLSLSCSSPYVLAYCNTSNNTYSFTLPNTPISVPQNKAVGPIGSVISVPAGTGANISCSAGTAYLMLMLGTSMTPSSYSPDVFETNVPGIGVKIWDDFSSTVVVKNTPTYWYTPGTNYSGVGWLTNIKLQFYIIGPVSTGDIAFQTPTVQSLANTAINLTGASVYNTLNIIGTVPVRAAACETPDITVKMGKHYSSEFTGVGSSIAAVPFDFTINNCQSGLSSIYYTLSPAAGVSVVNNGNANQYITLNNSSDARGVGIQLQYANGINVPFNTKTKYTAFSGVGNYTIPMQARYIQTGDIRGGRADSSVEFVMSYE